MLLNVETWVTGKMMIQADFYFQELDRRNIHVQGVLAVTKAICYGAMLRLIFARRRAYVNRP